MSTLTQAAFKRWQPLPLLSPPLGETAGANRSPECRTAKPTGPRGARLEHAEARPRQRGAGPTASHQTLGVAPIQPFQRS